MCVTGEVKLTIFGLLSFYFKRTNCKGKELPCYICHSFSPSSRAGEIQLSFNFWRLIKNFIFLNCFCVCVSVSTHVYVWPDCLVMHLFILIAFSACQFTTHPASIVQRGHQSRHGTIPASQHPHGGRTGKWVWIQASDSATACTSV